MGRARMSQRWVWLSGRVVPESEALVPASSRSVRLGMGVYETMRVRAGRAPLLELHLERLEDAARALALWPGPLDWAGALAELAARNGLADAVARITLGDGFALLGIEPLPAALSAQRREGIELLTVVLERPLAGLKSTSRADLELAERRAGGEALCVSAAGSLLETTRANFFAISDAGLQTAPVPDVLPGIARALVLGIAADRGIAVTERAPALADLDTWQEAFATNASRGIRAVNAIDGRSIGTGKPGPRALELQRALDARMGI
jgi:branched-chain amino acid aminotransferase